jgi:glutamine amidotransferase
VESIVVVDCGSGNLHSCAKAFEHEAANASVTISADPAMVRRADRLVLPGQGAFGDCMAGLNAAPGLRDALQDMVIEKQRPFLGICVGMQMLATTGYEDGTHAGLGWIPGEVVRLEPAPGLKIPHMGWNELVTDTPHPVTAGLMPGDHVYFVHSYIMTCADPAHELAHADYGQRIPAIVGRDNLLGMQFHPEKSQVVGLGLIRAFLGWRG